jgi:hypothetical protein
MDTDLKLARNAAKNAWLAAMAHAIGRHEDAEDYMASLIVVLGLTFPQGAEIVFDVERMERLHGASGSW